MVNAVIVTKRIVKCLYFSPSELDLKERGETGNLFPNIQGYNESKVMNAMNVKELARRLQGDYISLFPLFPPLGLILASSLISVPT